MKTKHFLITTEDGSPVAVVNAKNGSELIEKIHICIHEQLDDTSIYLYAMGSHPQLLMYAGERRMVLESSNNKCIMCQRIEIY